MELKNIKGIGPKTFELFSKLGINTIDDLVRYYPYRYNIFSPTDIGNSIEDTTIVITGKVMSSPKVSYIKRNFNRLSFMLETNNIICNVVIFNRAFMKNNLNIGKYITLIGKYNKLKNTFTASDIKLKPIMHTEVEPVYHMINGLKTSTLIKTIQNALDNNLEISEIVPEYISEKYELLNTYEAIKEIHTPTDFNKLKKAKLKLKYESRLFITN